MKNLPLLIICLCCSSIAAQVDITNLDVVLLDEEDDDTQHVTIDVKNISDTIIDLDWEVEFLENSDAFIDISVSDINLDYTPAIHTSCDLINVENMLNADQSYPMGLHFSLEEIPASFNKDSIIAFFHLYIAMECDKKILSLPIMFNSIVSTDDLANETSLKIFPNPTTDFINVQLDNQTGNLKYEIIDLAGRQIKIGNALDKTINVSALNPGVYLLKIKDELEKELKYFVKI